MKKKKKKYYLYIDYDSELMIENAPKPKLSLPL